MLALAEKTIPSKALPSYEGLIFLGLVGFRDPPRVEVKQAIADCRQAGIRVVMVTGDHAVTARKIAESVGIVEPGNCILVEGRELEALGALGEQERRRVLAAQVFARVTPAQKLELVLLYQSAGEVVAMTGDGVNDAPALQRADIGVAMGLRGTEVAREAADIVLRDDAFGSIVAAIREGRVIFSNLRRFLVYLLSCNISEVMALTDSMTGSSAKVKHRLNRRNNALKASVATQSRLPPAPACRATPWQHQSPLALAHASSPSQSSPPLGRIRRAARGSVSPRYAAKTSTSGRARPVLTAQSTSTSNFSTLDQNTVPARSSTNVLADVCAPLAHDLITVHHTIHLAIAIPFFFFSVLRQRIPATSPGARSFRRRRFRRRFIASCSIA